MAYLKMSKLAVKWVLRKPATTRYPAEPRQPFKGSRGQLVLDKNTCIYCTACQKKCPTAAIVVDRPNKTFALDRLRCISCGYCVEICPKDSLVLTTSHGNPSVLKPGAELQ
jgi:formate hydrogenlyase subunit 6/NADH:ubiquinone oxidoreductase subunit I